jgi:hypothetical protein
MRHRWPMWPCRVRLGWVGAEQTGVLSAAALLAHVCCALCSGECGNTYQEEWHSCRAPLLLRPADLVSNVYVAPASLCCVLINHLMQGPWDHRDPLL